MLEQEKIGGYGWMSVNDCAKFLDLHRNTIIKYIRKGKLKAIKVGHNLYKISTEDFKTFVDSLRFVVERVEGEKKIDKLTEDEIAKRIEHIKQN